MPKKPKSSSPPRSLFTVVTTPVPDPGRSYEEQLAFLKSMAASKPVIEQAIQQMRRRAQLASADPHLERGAERGEALTRQLDYLQHDRACVLRLIAHAGLDLKLEHELVRKINAAIWDAMKALEMSQMLQTDKLFGAAVGEKVNRKRAHAPRRTDEEIRAMLAKHEKVVDAAAALNMDVRAIQHRIDRPSQYLQKNAKR
jgi:hypothetical protein